MLSTTFFLNFIIFGCEVHQHFEFGITSVLIALEDYLSKEKIVQKNICKLLKQLPFVNHQFLDF